MKKKTLSIILIILSLAVVLKGEVLAEDVAVGKEEVIEGPYIKYGNNITISGTVNGDVFVAGSFITIDGQINGDLIAGGGVVTLKGEVTQDVRAAGGMVTIDGQVGRNVTALAGTVTFGSDADVDGDVLVAGGNLAHLGNIDGKAQVYTDEVTLAGRVGKDVEAQSDQVAVLKTAILDRNLLYTSDKEASVSAQARIAGAVKRTPVGKALTQVVPQARTTFFRFRLLSYLSMLLLGLVWLKIAPRQVTATAKLIGEQPWRSLGLGFLGLVLTPMAVVILMISIIGVPLAALLGLGYIVVVWLSSLFAGLFVGQKVFDWVRLKENVYAMLAVGLLLLHLLFAAPVVGSFVRILSILAATGAVLILQREALRRLEIRTSQP